MSSFLFSANFLARTEKTGVMSLRLRFFALESPKASAIPLVLKNALSRAPTSTGQSAVLTLLKVGQR
jgi:hypothetical protein